MKTKYPHIFEPMTIRQNDRKKQNRHDTNGNKLR